MRELRKKTKINRLTLDINKRMIFISDIHGDLETMKQGLLDLNFSDDDYLFIIGDIYEKGDKGTNLDIARYVMELSHSHPNVYPMAGNCDEVLRFVLPKDQASKVLWYMHRKEISILNDMADELNMKVETEDDVIKFVDIIQEKYKDLYDFMDELDDIITINDSIILVHAGLDSIYNIPEYSMSVLKYDNFQNKSRGCDKLTIVGHYPTRNYRPDVSCVNPIFDLRKKIISIDGGNHVVKGGQINFLILESLKSMRFTYKYYDHYEKYTMKCDKEYNTPDVQINITYGDNEIEILAKDLDYYFVKHTNTGLTMWVDRTFVYKDQKTGKMCCYDASNQFLSVKKGDYISVIRRANPYSIVKKNGFIGLIETKYIEDVN
ncbi:MAG: metallophosphoesterase [Acholeplasmatales bacterium]|nr:metallophosphoesterase [Acholeplasmatales bacterium]